jgi:hypothetical protein
MPKPPKVASCTFEKVKNFWERFQNCVKGFRITISKLDRGEKEREKKAFNVSPQDAVITLLFWVE